MVTLRRTVRFSINLDDAGRPIEPGPSYNAYAGHPSPIALGRYFEIGVTCRGEADPRTGYLINIKQIDEAVRHAAIPLLARACAERADAQDRRDPIRLLPDLVAAVQGNLPVEVAALALRLTPYYLVVGTEDRSAALLINSFDLSASHRLNCPELSPEQNRAVFGKCNNPSGHGHNYRVEPHVLLDLATLDAHPFSLQTLERITDQTIIQRFDHKHLNLDTPEFADPGDGTGGVNPTVENIARVFFELLAPQIREASAAATLRGVTVWETDRTCATYPG